MLVVVFDDNLLSLATLLAQLQSSGHEAISASTVLDAQRAMPRRPDVLLVNLTAHSFDPPALISQLLREPAVQGAHIVGFCGHIDESRKKRALEAGCHHVISNAQAHKQLVSTLQGLGLWPDHSRA